MLETVSLQLPGQFLMLKIPNICRISLKTGTIMMKSITKSKNESDLIHSDYYCMSAKIGSILWSGFAEKDKKK